MIMAVESLERYASHGMAPGTRGKTYVESPMTSINVRDGRRRAGVKKLRVLPTVKPIINPARSHATRGASPRYPMAPLGGKVVGLPVRDERGVRVVDSEVRIVRSKLTCNGVGGIG